MALPLTEKLLKDEPQRMAETIGGKKDTINQIRKFYDDFLLLQKKADSGVDFEKSILPMIKFSEAKLAYAVSRGTMSDGLRKSLADYIEKIQTKEDFDNFILFYQAFIAYYKYHEYEREEKRKQASNNSGYSKPQNYRNGGLR